MAAAVTHPIHYPQGAWWRHQTDTFSALLVICAGNSPVNGEFPAQKPVRRSFAVFLDLRLNKRLSKQWWSWWFETPLRSLLRHCNDTKLRWFSAICLPIFLRLYSLARGQVLLKWPRRALGNLTIAPVPAKQPWWIWINTSCEFIMNDCITTTKQSTTKPCAHFLGYTVHDCRKFRSRVWSMD